MGYKLANQFKPVTGLGGHAKSVLLQMADAASEQTHIVRLSMSNLLIYADISLRTGQRALRCLEQLGYLIPEGGKGGRGHVLEYFVSDAPLNKPVESAPVVLPEHVPPPTNGHRPTDHPPSDLPALPPEGDGELAKLRQALARRQETQAQNIQAGKPSELLEHLIASTERKIKNLEQKSKENANATQQIETNLPEPPGQTDYRPL